MIVRRDDIQLSGTLTLPPGAGPFPTLVLISGSGPQNRDWDFDRNGEYVMGRIIAADLSRNGIAVFRYDDRGVGQSTGEGEDIRQLSQDVLSVVQSLRDIPEIGKIGLCGHSLGGEAALRAAAENKQIDFLVLLSTPFITGEDIMLAQANDMPDMYRSSESQTNEEASRDGVDFVRAIAANPPNNQNRQNAIRLFQKIFRRQIETRKEEERRDIGDLDKRILDDATNLVNHFLSPESQFFLHYNPVADLKKVECPLVVLFGEGDQHVKLHMNMKPFLEGAAESKIRSLSVKIIPDINHFYTAPPYRSKGEMYPGVTEFISHWIQNSI